MGSPPGDAPRRESRVESNPPTVHRDMLDEWDRLRILGIESFDCFRVDAGACREKISNLESIDALDRDQRSPYSVIPSSFNTGAGIMKINACASGVLGHGFRGGLLGSILCAGAITFGSSASASMLRVPAQYPTIQTAIDAAVDGDVVSIKAGLYLPAATLDTLGKVITVQGEVGPSGTPLVTIDGQDVITVLQCVNSEGQGTLFEHLIIRNGRAPQRGGGMLILNGSSPTLFNCTFIDNDSGCSGGAVASISQSAAASCHPSFVNCTFEGNEASCDGGGFFADGGSSVFVFCQFKNNIADHGGGLANLAGFTGLIDCELSCNDATADGGALHFGPLATVNILDSTIQWNSAVGAGGGILFSSNVQSLGNTTLCGNTPNQIQGIYLDAGGNSIAAVCVGICPDPNGDGIVDGADLAILLGAWGPCGGSSCPGDVNGDGLVDGSDLALILGAWGPCSGC